MFVGVLCDESQHSRLKTDRHLTTEAVTEINRMYYSRFFRHICLKRRSPLPLVPLSAFAGCSSYMVNDSGNAAQQSIR
jgi:hypothetical protein